MATKIRAAVVIAGVVLAGCGGGPQSGGGKVSGDAIRLGVITDLSGVYSEVGGKNSVESVRMAVDDFTKRHADDAVTKNIEVSSADHQNKPEIANTAAREMYDRNGVDAIFDVPTSSAALAIATVAKQQKKLYFNTGAATTELTGAQCNAYTYHYAYDTYMLAHGTGTTLTEQGAKRWYIIYPDYAFGQDMNKSFTAAVEAAGGTVGAADPTPFPNDNFATFMTKAPNLNPKPDVLGVMQAGGDLVNVVKQYNEFGLKDKGVGLAVGLMFDTDIASIGVESLAGTVFTTAWFWNLDGESKEWADRFKERTGKRPTFDHAATYSAATQYLEAVQRAGTDDADTVRKELDGREFSDFFARNAKIRAEDHRVVHDSYLVRVKDPADMEEDGDFTELIEKIPADEAFRKASDSGCDMG
ncbi:ABC transporter substrate-binding protein [Actinophytocola oryzae]|uniref:Amino acid/amide ABC transporter substrate-binding protein (HAAT family) n=1 Tax=Actinophytocola oryzae TaxID=502181 RepID=A0A4R7V769_9PSEU|nr:ABC transporter substrate-binding protein [Actinophytocola oryzae]TDV44794.1 amino acid/amide ABC transporter substrate-binding protein (HAAT family) [Actinophytocola oryzae]